MSDYMELALKRQSTRQFADKPVEHEKLVKCVEAARLSPSGCNAQPWSFIVVEKPEVVAEVAKTTMQLGINEYIAKAKAFFVVVEEYAQLMPKIAKIVHSQYFAKGDLGAVSLSLCLEAQSQGLGTCMLGIFDRPKLRELFDIPKDKDIFIVIAVGYPSSDQVRTKDRKPLEELVRFV
ncbi:MAG: nitroreductase family protein [Deltaproteobacteria bacterium]|jgi:nitroreductase|nr:nitroreductase family protein [Deltaproteobacteria bacterium]